MKNKNTNNIDLHSTEYFFNRELSLIDFNKRVLLEADDKSHPLLERLKFCCILSSNLDEFFMIRVAGLKGQIASEVVELSYDGKTPKEQLIEVRKQLVPIFTKHSEILNLQIMPALEKHGIYIHNLKDLPESEKSELEQYFINSVLPILTPLTLGPANPFPRLINRSLNVAFVLNDSEKTNEDRVAFVQLPSVLPRFVNLERKTGHHFILVEQLIKEFANILFPGLDVKTANTFRVTRDADIEIAEDEAEDLLSEIAEQIKKRRWGRAAVRLEVSSKMPEFLVELLTEFLDLEPIDVYVHDRPLNLPDFMEFLKLDIRELKDKPFAPRNIPELNGRDVNVFEAIKQQDILVHHPYDSFASSTLKFINQAANDPNVLAIKITMYRTGQNSAIVAALKKAAEDGKSVTAFVELKARFDEEKNITWAKELEHHGVHVVYGVLGLKTHCKICSVVRKESDQLKTYLHLSTGNYNQSTSRLYTDLGFFTANQDFGKDATHLFNILTGYSHFKDWKEFFVAPTTLYKKTLELIEREIELSTPENPGMIFAKMNQLAHREVIPALYKASQAGVKIKLLVRGLCCLRPGLKGISENIEVRSIIGRFLEHSRIFYFKNGGDEEFYLSSADWMSRNFHKRMELMFPIYDKRLRERIWDSLNIYWADNRKSWRLTSTGEYEKIKPRNPDAVFSSQDFFLDELKLLRNSEMLL